MTQTLKPCQNFDKTNDVFPRTCPDKWTEGQIDRQRKGYKEPNLYEPSDYSVIVLGQNCIWILDAVFDFFFQKFVLLGTLLWALLCYEHLEGKSAFLYLCWKLSWIYKIAPATAGGAIITE